MQDIVVLLGISLIIALGAFIRQHLVYFRKNGFDFEQYNLNYLIENFITIALEIFVAGAASEFLAFGFDLDNLATYAAAFGFGYAGHDFAHQVYRKFKLNPLLTVFYR